MKRKDDFHDGNYPSRLDRYIDLDDVPDDLIDRVALEYIVKCVCRECGHEDYYTDADLHEEPDCKGPSCSEQILLD